MIRTLKALLTIVPKDDVRYYLNGVHVVSNSDGSVQVEVSDGHMCISLQLKDSTFNVSPDTDVIICRHSLARMVKVFGTKDTPVFTINNESAKLGEYDVTLIEGRFPDCKRVFSLGKGSVPAFNIGMNFDLLYKICKACSGILHHETFRIGNFEIRDGNSPFYITQTFSTVNTLTALIMPARL